LNNGRGCLKKAASFFVRRQVEEKNSRQSDFFREERKLAIENSLHYEIIFAVNFDFPNSDYLHFLQKKIRFCQNFS
jgi:hypothetical protein